MALRVESRLPDLIRHLQKGAWLCKKECLSYEMIEMCKGKHIGVWFYGFEHTVYIFVTKAGIF